MRCSLPKPSEADALSPIWKSLLRLEWHGTPLEADDLHLRRRWRQRPPPLQRARTHRK